MDDVLMMDMKNALIDAEVLNIRCHAIGSDDEEGEVDMDSVLFTTMQAKQSGRASLPQMTGKLHMPDTPVKHAGRASMPAQRLWQTATKNSANVDKCKFA